MTGDYRYTFTTSDGVVGIYTKEYSSDENIEMASLASATSSRVDSASKHIVPCKVNTDFMVSTQDVGISDALRELQQNKMKYCMHKDDIVLGLGRPTYETSIHTCMKKAYPSVISTVATTSIYVRRWLALTNFLTEDRSDVKALLVGMKAAIGEPAVAAAAAAAAPLARALTPTEQQVLDKRNKLLEPLISNKLMNDIINMVDYHFVGVSLGTAYSHQNSGDTVGSVMVGGLKTILNGGFKIHTNDLLAFYFDEEFDLFHEDGSRKSRPVVTHVLVGGAQSINIVDEYLQILNGLGVNYGINEQSADAKRRKVFHEQGNGNYQRTQHHLANAGKANVPKIKPLLDSRYNQDFPCDRRRVFGRAISNAMPYEMVDIVLSRQSI
jgi:hypothetical protein